ncbi:MAG: asparagine synthase-related protein [Sphingomonas sp.]
MSGRYIAIIGNTDSAARAAVRDLPGFSVLLDRPTLLFACDPCIDRIELAGDCGVIAGTLFARSAPAPTTRLEETAARAILGSRGKLLIDQYWGSYVAFLMDASGNAHVLRDPSGATGCYLAPLERGYLLTSDVRACASLGLIAKTIDWEGVAEHLLWPERRGFRTCITGVRELMPGSRLSIHGHQVSIEQIWVPWRFTSATMRIDDPREAAERVREAVLDTAQAWCGRYVRPLISLSGGLDSSIVMASMATSASAVTISTHEALGDERPYARAVADRCAVALIERELDPGSISPTCSNAAALPRPVSRLFAQGIDRLWRQAIASSDADALFHGGGGDNVFCYLNSSTPYLDCLLAARPMAQRRAVLESLSAMTQVSRWRIRRAALRKMVVDRGRYRWRRHTRMLSRAATSMTNSRQLHPWIEAMPATTLPGKRAHVAALIRIQNYLEAVQPPQSVPVIAPLMSQMVIETCLRISTWLWCRDGINRAVARDAFRDLLPATVVGRRSKGSPAAFDAKVVTAMRPALRALLHDGHLAARGLIDLNAVDQALGEEGPLRGDGYLRVTELVDVEAWLQSWIGAPSAAERLQS